MEEELDGDRLYDCLVNRTRRITGYASNTNRWSRERLSDTNSRYYDPSYVFNAWNSETEKRKKKLKELKNTLISFIQKYPETSTLTVNSGDNFVEWTSKTELADSRIHLLNTHDQATGNGWEISIYSSPKTAMVGILNFCYSKKLSSLTEKEVSTWLENHKPGEFLPSLQNKYQELATAVSNLNTNLDLECTL